MRTYVCKDPTCELILECGTAYGLCISLSQPPRFLGFEQVVRKRSFSCLDFFHNICKNKKNAAIVLHSPEISVTATHPSPRLYPTSSNAHPSPLLPYTREAEQKPEEPEKPRVGLVRPTGKENTGGGTVS